MSHYYYLLFPYVLHISTKITVCPYIIDIYCLCSCMSYMNLRNSVCVPILSSSVSLCPTCIYKINWISLYYHHMFLCSRMSYMNLRNSMHHPILLSSVPVCPTCIYKNTWMSQYYLYILVCHT